MGAGSRPYGSSGTRSLYAACEDIRVCHADKGGLPADASDPVAYDPDEIRMYDFDPHSP